MEKFEEPIRSEELRIGNLLRMRGDKRQIVRITAIHGNDEIDAISLDGEGMALSTGSVEPIQLTDGLLSKIAKIDGKSMGGKGIKDERLQIRFNDVMFVFHVVQKENANAKYIHCTCLHELQNLYFAILGRELEMEDVLNG